MENNSNISSNVDNNKHGSHAHGHDGSSRNSQYRRPYRSSRSSSSSSYWIIILIMTTILVMFQFLDFHPHYFQVHQQQQQQQQSSNPFHPILLLLVDTNQNTTTTNSDEEERISTTTTTTISSLRNHTHDDGPCDDNHRFTGDDNDDDSDGWTYHLVFSTSCTIYQDWQSYVMFYNAWRVYNNNERKTNNSSSRSRRQHPLDDEITGCSDNINQHHHQQHYHHRHRHRHHITRIVSGCTDDQRQALQSQFDEYIVHGMPSNNRIAFHIHFTPDYSNVKVHSPQKELLMAQTTTTNTTTTTTMWDNILNRPGRFHMNSPYKYFNKPFGMTHWFHSTFLGPNHDDNPIERPFDLLLDRTIIVLLDPDQLIQRPFVVEDINRGAAIWTTDTQRRLTRKMDMTNNATTNTTTTTNTISVDDGNTTIHSYGRLITSTSTSSSSTTTTTPTTASTTPFQPTGQKYGYGTIWTHSLNWTDIVPSNSRIFGMIGKPIDTSWLPYIVGPPYIATATHWNSILQFWPLYSLEVHEYIQHAQGIYCEMFGYSIATAHLGLQHRIATNFMVSHPKSSTHYEGWNYVDDLIPSNNNTEDDNDDENNRNNNNNNNINNTNSLPVVDKSHLICPSSSNFIENDILSRKDGSKRRQRRRNDDILHNNNTLNRTEVSIKTNNNNTDDDDDGDDSYDTVYRAPFVLHFCQQYGLGPFSFSKLKVRQEQFVTSCSEPLLADPRFDQIIIHPNTSAILKVFEKSSSKHFNHDKVNNEPSSNLWDLYDYQTDIHHMYGDDFIPLSPLERRRSAFMICRLIGQLNEASTHFKDTHCNSSSSVKFHSSGGDNTSNSSSSGHNFTWSTTTRVNYDRVMVIQ